MCAFPSKLSEKKSILIKSVQPYEHIFARYFHITKFCSHSSSSWIIIRVTTLSSQAVTIRDPAIPCSSTCFISNRYKWTSIKGGCSQHLEDRWIRKWSEQDTLEKSSFLFYGRDLVIRWSVKTSLICSFHWFYNFVIQCQQLQRIQNYLVIQI